MDLCWRASSGQTDRLRTVWKVVQAHTLPSDLLLCLFAECQSIADLCILQSVRAFLGEVRHYRVRKLQQVSCVK